MENVDGARCEERALEMLKGFPRESIGPAKDVSASELKLEWCRGVVCPSGSL